MVGARCAGSPTAMLLARKGYRVLVVDRATFPSDTISTHLIHPPGVAALQRWGLLDRVVATGCPPIDTYAFDFGPFTIPGAREPPRRRSPTPAAHRARQAAGGCRGRGGRRGPRGVHRRELVIEDGRVTGIRGHGKGGATVTERARVVDRRGRPPLAGRRGGRAPSSTTRSRRCWSSYYSYWSGLPMDGRFETYVRPERGFAAWPTNDDLTLVIAGWPYAEFEANRKDIEGNYLETLDLVPRVRRAPPRGDARGALRRHGRAATSSASRTDRAGRWSATPATTRTSSPRRGSATPSATPSCAPPRWTRPSPARRPFEDAMADYQADARRAASLPMYEFTRELATLEPPPPELQQLLAAVHGNQAAMDGFVRVLRA